MDKPTTKDILIIVLLALGVALVGVFLINQAIDYMYKLQLVNDPCKLCCQKAEGFECPKPEVQSVWDFDSTGKPILKVNWVEP